MISSWNYNIKPEGVIFVGHQLAKKEVVEYLSAISATTQVKVLIGTDATGYNPLDNPESFLKQYLNKAEVRKAKYPIRSQVLIAVNTTTRREWRWLAPIPTMSMMRPKGKHHRMDSQLRGLRSDVQRFQQAVPRQIRHHGRTTDHPRPAAAHPQDPARFLRVAFGRLAPREPGTSPGWMGMSSRLHRGTAYPRSRTPRPAPRPGLQTTFTRR